MVNKASSSDKRNEIARAFEAVVGDVADEKKAAESFLSKRVSTGTGSVVLSFGSVQGAAEDGSVILALYFSTVKGATFEEVNGFNSYDPLTHTRTHTHTYHTPHTHTHHGLAQLWCCLSIGPRCIGGGEEHLVIHHPEQWQHILPVHLAMVPCQNFEPGNLANTNFSCLSLYT